jgi:hypothetical protein
MGNIFEDDLKRRLEDQEKKKASNGLDNKAKGERINISLPKDYKDRLVEYAAINHMNPSQVIRKWIDENIGR